MCIIYKRLIARKSLCMRMLIYPSRKLVNSHIIKKSNLKKMKIKEFMVDGLFHGISKSKSYDSDIMHNMAPYIYFYIIFVEQHHTKDLGIISI